MVRTVSVAVTLASLLLTAMIVPRGASAGVEVNIREAFTVTQQTCTGETITIAGEVHFVRRFTESASGNVISGIHLNSVSGIATSASGVRYLLRDGSTTAATNAFLEPPSAESFTATIRFRLIALGESAPDDDLFFRAVFDFTVAPSGETRAEFGRVTEFECA
jgi:hypothetical protein